MNRFLALVLLAAVASAQSCGRRNNASFLKSSLLGGSDYVVGGTQAIKNEFPWQISLQVFASPAWWISKSWQHICGGSILDERYVVTAAHCIITNDASAYRVVVGSQYNMKIEDTTVRLDVDQIFVHPGWQMETVKDDIAVLRLKTPIKLNPKSAYPVCLPEANESFDEATCTTSGWGRIYQDGPASEVLLKVDLPIVSNPICLTRYRDVMNARITREKICAGRLDAFGFGVCQGDSGGPLACAKGGVYKLAGVTSFGVVCGSNQHPAVYTRVSAYLSWIKAILAKK